MAGTLFVVATPIGNLEDITVRALRVLGSVSVIAAEDTRRTAHLLARHGITTSMTSLHEHNERTKTPVLLDRLGRGESVALVSDAGTPTVADPGARLVAAAAEQGIRVEPIPGPNAAIATLSAAGFDADGFVFLGFPPTKGSARREWFERLAAAAPVAVFYEAPHRIFQTLDEAVAALGDVPAVLARELTKVHEQFLRGSLSAVRSQLDDPVGEFTVAVFVGEKTKKTLAPTRPAASEADILTEFGQITANRASTRRQAIATLARKHGVPAREIYARLEAAKKSGG